MSLRAFGFLIASSLALGCGAPDGEEITGTIPFTPERPVLTGVVGADPAPYTGADPYVTEAQKTYRTGADVQRKLVLRTCGPTNGVCHNQKEYPDLHTEATFTAAIGAPCNVQPGSFTSVFDRCERRGDRFRFRDADWTEIEVGWLQYIQGPYVDFQAQDTWPDIESAGVHLVLHDPLPGTQKTLWGTGTFIRNFVDDQGNVAALPFASYTTRWYVVGDDRKHLFAEVRDYQLDDVQGLASAGIVQGDQNQNGVFGARERATVAEINPGKPEQSYLVSRLRGFMLDERTSDTQERVLGSRMPLANQPPSIADMVALMCFIEQLDPVARAWNIEQAIDYNACSYTADPTKLSLIGTGTTWRGRIFPLLQSKCGGCHGGAAPSAGLDFTLPEADLYVRLKQKSTQLVDLKLIEPGNPNQSYLWRKIAGDGTILKSRMPGGDKLPPEDIDDITNWILYGAPEDG